MKKIQSIKLHIPRVVCYFIWLCAAIYLFTFLRSYFILLFIIISIVLPMLSVAMALYMKDKINVIVSAMQQSVMRDGTARFQVSVVNSSSWGMSLDCVLTGTIKNTFYDTNGDITLSLPITMNDTQRLILPFDTEYCGCISLQLNRLEYKDILGLFSVSQNIDTIANTVILPVKSNTDVTDTSAFADGVSEAEESKTKGSDFSEVVDIREYHPGDRLKDIHWKISAKRDILMVKERESLSQTQLVMLLDLSDEKAATENILNLGYNLAIQLVRENTPVRLVWWNTTLFRFSQGIMFNDETIDTVFCRLLQECVKTQQTSDVRTYLWNCLPQLNACVFIYNKNGNAEGEVAYRD